MMSLSARRAWIEMPIAAFLLMWYQVALRKESVDRNVRAYQRYFAPHVALRKESVDRNCRFWRFCRHTNRRSPQGERG